MFPQSRVLLVEDRNFIEDELLVELFEFLLRSVFIFDQRIKRGFEILFHIFKISEMVPHLLLYRSQGFLQYFCLFGQLLLEESDLMCPLVDEALEASDNLRVERMIRLQFADLLGRFVDGLFVLFLGIDSE